MELVCRIYEAGSLSKAARVLGVSQPSLTAALHRIEKAAGGRLFDRSKQGMVPTDLGEYLLTRARPLVNEVRALRDAVRQRAEKGSSRSLRVVIAPGPYLGKFLATLSDRREVDARVDWGVADHVQRMGEGRLDVAVLGYDPAIPLSLPLGVRTRHLVDAEPCWVALGEHHPLANKPEIDLADLSDVDWIAPPGGDSDGTTAAFESACRAAGFSPRIRYRLDEVSAVTQMLVGTEAVIIAQPTCRRTAGVVARPLRGNPMQFRITFAWRASALSDEDAGEIFALLVTAYAEVIGNNEPYPTWWRANPWAHTDPAWSSVPPQATSQASATSSS